MLKRVLVIVFALGLCIAASGQSEGPGLAVHRTFMIQTNLERGSAFAVDIDNREYWITAKHLFTGIRTGPAGEFKEKQVTASLLARDADGPPGQDQHWLTQTFMVIDPGKDIDILVLAPSKALFSTAESSIMNPTSEGIMYGGDCEFLGFPYGGGWKAQGEDNKPLWLPFIKHCAVSGQITSNGIKVFVLDGIDNEGFSGGPVLYGTGKDQRVFAVISASKQEPLEVLPVPVTPNAGQIPTSPTLQGQTPKQIVNANAGFIVAFDISPAVDAIRKTPIGPAKDQKQ